MARAQATYEEYIAKAQAEELERERKALLRNEQLHKRLTKLFKEPPHVREIQESARLWNYVFERPRVNGQRERRRNESFMRMAHLRMMGSCDHLAKLIFVMSWHPDHIYVVIVATRAGVTTAEFTEVYGLQHSNHRMVLRRINKALQHLGWHFVAQQVGAQNEPWGWWLEKLDDQSPCE